MNINIPRELSDYTHNKQAGIRSRQLILILGWIVIIAFIGTPTFFIVGKPTIGVLCLVIAFLAAFTNIWLARKKRVRKCPRCYKPMDVLDVNWSSNDYIGVKRKFPGIILGADGLVYNAKARDGAGHNAPQTVFVIEQLLQRWSICHKCKLCFCTVEIVPDEVYKTQKTANWEKTQDLIKSDPEAVEMKKIHKL
jgi:hypothetical protein